MQFAIGISKPRLTIFWNLCNFPLMLVPGYMLLFGKFGAPKLGVIGMGYAQAGMYWLMCIIVMVHLIYRGDHKKFMFFSKKNLFDFKSLREILGFGYFITGQISAEMLTFFATTLMIGRFGEAPLAARQITIQVCSLLLMIPYGLSQANSVLISNAWGSSWSVNHKMEVIRRSAYSAIFLVGVFGLIMGGVFCFMPKFIIGFYLDINNAKNLYTIHIAELFLLIAALSQFFDCMKVVAVGVLRGVFDIKIPMFVSIFVSCFMSLPIGYLLAFVFKIGPSGVLWGFVFTCFLGAVLLIRRINKITAKI